MTHRIRSQAKDSIDTGALDIARLQLVIGIRPNLKGRKAHNEVAAPLTALGTEPRTDGNVCVASNGTGKLRCTETQAGPLHSTSALLLTFNPRLLGGRAVLTNDASGLAVAATRSHVQR